MNILAIGCLHAPPVYALARQHLSQPVCLVMVALYLINPVFLGHPQWSTPLVLWALWALGRGERLAYVLALSGAVLAQASCLTLLMLALVAACHALGSKKPGWVLPPLAAGLALGSMSPPHWPFLLTASQLFRSLGWHLSPLAWLPLAAPVGLIVCLPPLITSGTEPACSAALPFLFWATIKGLSRVAELAKPAQRRGACTLILAFAALQALWQGPGTPWSAGNYSVRPTLVVDQNPANFIATRAWMEPAQLRRQLETSLAREFVLESGCPSRGEWRAVLALIGFTPGSGQAFVPNRAIVSADPILKQLYADFFEQDLSEQALLRLSSRVSTLDHAPLAAQCLRDPAYFERGAWICRCYLIGLGRRPEFPEFQRGPRRTQDRPAWLKGFVESQEFRTQHDGEGLIDFIHHLLRNAGKSAPELQPGLSPGQILERMVDLPENKQHLANSTLICLAYFGFFRRSPDERGFGNYLGLLEKGMTDEELARAFISSDEYRNR